MSLNHIIIAFLLAGVLAVGYAAPASADKVIIVEDGHRGGHRHEPPGHSKRWKKHRHDRYCEHREVHHYYHEEPRHSYHGGGGGGGSGFGFWVTGLK